MNFFCFSQKWITSERTRGLTWNWWTFVVIELKLIVNLTWTHSTVMAPVVPMLHCSCLVDFIKVLFDLRPFLPWGGWLGGGIICWCVESVLLNTKLSFASSEPDGDEPAVSPLPARSRFKWWSGILSIGAASTAHSISASSPIERSAGNRSRMRAKRPFLSGKVV